jgi:hypothetical protein
MAAPEGSVIVPESAPPATCASIGREFTRQNPKMHTKHTTLMALGIIGAHPLFYFIQKVKLMDVRRFLSGAIA